MNRSGCSDQTRVQATNRCWTTHRSGGPTQLATLVVNARIPADTLDQCEHTRAVIVALYHEVRVVVVDGHTRHKPRQFEPAHMAGEFGALQARLHIHNLRRGIVSFATTARRVDRHQVTFAGKGR